MPGIGAVFDPLAVGARTANSLTDRYSGGHGVCQTKERGLAHLLAGAIADQSSLQFLPKRGANGVSFALLAHLASQPSVHCN